MQEQLPPQGRNKEGLGVRGAEAKKRGSGGGAGPRASEEGCCPAGLAYLSGHKGADSRSEAEKLEIGTAFCCQDVNHRWGEGDQNKKQIQSGRSESQLPPPPASCFPPASPSAEPTRDPLVCRVPAWAPQSPI